MNFNQVALWCRNGLLIFITVIVFTTYISAQHRMPSMCGLENSEKIFVSTFIKQNKKADKGKESEFVAEFSVGQSIKGIKPNENKIKASSGLFAKHLKTNEIYLVFVTPKEIGKDYRIVNALDATLLYETANKSKKLNRLSVDLHFAIGWIPVAQLEQLKDYKINISANGKFYHPKFAEGGLFTLVYPANAKVSVSIESLIKVGVSIDGTPGWEITSEAGHTIVKYDL